MLITKKEQDIYADYRTYIDDNFDECAKRAKIIHEQLERSPLFYNGEIKSKSLIIPKVYSQETFNFLEHIQKITHKICEKVVDRYINDPSYRDIFPYSKELEELILVPRNYESLLPMSRYDIFLNEETGDFGFCEFNTDGTSGMDENRVHDMTYIDNAAHQYIKTRYNIRPFELFDTWVDDFLSLYKTYKFARSAPRVLITDFFDAGRVNEFKEYARRFQARGIECHVCDIRNLTYDGHVLRTDLGYEVDSVYKRACTGDVMDRIDEVEPFINAVKDERLFMIGAFSSQLIHNKWIFNALHNEKTKAFLTDDENDFVLRHVPKTVPFNSEGIKADVLADKDSYILKPLDGYASSGVHAGVEHDNSQWKSIVEECFGEKYICQDYCPQYRTDNIDMVFGGREFKPYINMTGLYSFNGKLVGFFNRLSDGGIIRTYSNERMVPTYLIQD